MSLGTSNRDGGKTSESGHLRALAKMVTGDVITGLNVSQRSAGANMSVDIAIGDAFVRRSDGSYAHPVFNDAVYNQAIAAADGSNPRRDLIVLYVDYSQAPSTAVSNNTNGVVKIKVVTGTPAGSPVDPNSTAIQSSVGAGNPYTVLARVRVPAGQTSITNSLIDDLRTLITNKANTVNTAAIQDNAVDYTKLAPGTVLQVVETDFNTLLAAGGSGAAIPYDNTIPQITEGFEVMTRAITPKLATSDLLIEVSIYGSVNGTGASEFIGALFRDSTANAIAANSQTVPGQGYLSQLKLTAKVSAGSTSASTFRVRIGSTDGRNTSFNGYASGTAGVGTQVFASAIKSSIRIMEVKA